MVLVLLQQKFNVDIKYCAGDSKYEIDPRTGRYVEIRCMETPLTTAVSHGQHACMNLLLAAGADSNFADSHGLTALFTKPLAPKLLAIPKKAASWNHPLRPFPH